jgi:hypothetical protein
MDSTNYIGMDVHKETVSIAVMNSAELVMDSILETKAATILQFIQGLRGNLHVTFEEGTWAAWLYDLLKPHVAKIVVCDPRRNALLKEGNKSDKVDARKLVELLRAGLLRPVYHGANGLRTLKELSRSYLTVALVPTPLFFNCFPRFGIAPRHARNLHMVILRPVAARTPAGSDNHKHEPPFVCHTAHITPVAFGQAAEPLLSQVREPRFYDW